MSSANLTSDVSAGTPAKNPKMPPRERILAAARELFYSQGIRAVSVDAIAEAADTNKMTLYRHFESKDALVAEYLRGVAQEYTSQWNAVAAAHEGNPEAHLKAWIDHVAAAHEKARLIQSRQRAIVRIVILSGADAHMRKQRLHFGALHHRVVELLQAYIAFEQRTRNGKLNTEQRIHAAARAMVFQRGRLYLAQRDLDFFNLAHIQSWRGFQRRIDRTMRAIAHGISLDRQALAQDMPLTLSATRARRCINIRLAIG